MKINIYLKKRLFGFEQGGFGRLTLVQTGTFNLKVLEESETSAVHKFIKMIRQSYT